MKNKTLEELKKNYKDKITKIRLDRAFLAGKSEGFKECKEIVKLSK